MDITTIAREAAYWGLACGAIAVTVALLLLIASAATRSGPAAIEVAPPTQPFGFSPF